MELRNLKLEDAPLMLEWMHDASVVKNMKAYFMAKTLDNCISFIHSAVDQTESLHMAIVDDTDEYMGTVSLKHIKDGSAEFGITVRACAMGKGYSSFGMRSIVEKGFSELGLHMIYWCVDPKNDRAVRFYEKNGYHRCNVPKQALGYSDEEKKQYYWYCVER